MSGHIGLIAFLSLIIGLLIGIALTYFSPFYKGSMIQRQLTERDLQLKKLHTDIDTHFEQLGDVAARLQQQSQDITQLLANEAKLLAQSQLVKKRFALLSGEISQADYDEENAAHFIAPRDYADSNDSLSEKFSANFNALKSDEPPIAPRY